MLQLAAASQGLHHGLRSPPHDVTKRRARGKNECARRAILHWSGAHEWRKGEAADRSSRSSTKRRPLFPQGGKRVHIHTSYTTKKPSIFFLREEEGWRERRGERGERGRRRGGGRPLALPLSLPLSLSAGLYPVTPLVSRGWQRAGALLAGQSQRVRSGCNGGVWIMYSLDGRNIHRSSKLIGPFKSVKVVSAGPIYVHVP